MMAIFTSKIILRGGGDPRPRGFTLLELMVTVSLLAFFALAAAKTFQTGNWLAHYRLKGAARDLASNMQKARMNAIKENRPWVIVFDPAAGTYQVWNSGLHSDWDATRPDNVLVETVRLADYRSGIAYGFGSVAVGAAGEGIPAAVTFDSQQAVFNQRGFQASPPVSNAGTVPFCYLTNDSGTILAVGASLAGSIRIRTWGGGAWK